MTNKEIEAIQERNEERRVHLNGPPRVFEVCNAAGEGVDCCLEETDAVSDIDALIEEVERLRFLLRLACGAPLRTPPEREEGG